MRLLAAMATAAVFAAGCNGPIQRAGLPSGSGQAVRAPQIPAVVPHMLPAHLYVTSFRNKTVEILANDTWKKLGTIVDGVGQPWGDWVDGDGNLYVTSAKPNGKDAIVEYHLPGKSPTFTYNAKMTSPVSVTTDGHGNVYEADYIGHYVNEYAQKKDAVIASCSLSSDELVTGVAVNHEGTVFVDYTTAEYSGRIVKFKGGLSGCHKTTLAPKFKYPYGMAIDAHGALLVCDLTANKVDVLDPPFDKISGEFGIFYKQPIHIALNKANTEAYITQAGLSVRVMAYPRGRPLANLEKANGVVDPYGAVDGQNFVP